MGAVWARHSMCESAFSTLCRAIQSVLFIASLNMAAVMESAGRCGLFMWQICRPPGKDKGNFVCCLCTDWKTCSSSTCLCLWHMALSHRHRVSSVHNTLHLSGSVNKPHVSGGVEFAARIVVTVLRHSWRLENCGVQTGWSVKRTEGLMNKLI